VGGKDKPFFFDLGVRLIKVDASATDFTPPAELTRPGVVAGRGVLIMMLGVLVIWGRLIGTSGVLVI
jgi:hypothetical protein